MEADRKGWLGTDNLSYLLLHPLEVYRGNKVAMRVEQEEGEGDFGKQYLVQRLSDFIKSQLQFPSPRTGRSHPAFQNPIPGLRLIAAVHCRQCGGVPKLWKPSPNLDLHLLFIKLQVHERPAPAKGKHSPLCMLSHYKACIFQSGLASLDSL